MATVKGGIVSPNVLPKKSGEIGQTDGRKLAPVVMAGGGLRSLAVDVLQRANSVKGVKTKKFSGKSDSDPPAVPYRWQDNKLVRRLRGESPRAGHRSEPSEYANRGLKAGRLDFLLQPLVVFLLGGASKAFMAVAKRVRLDGREQLERALLDRQKGRGLLTACNHSAALDDPLILAASIPSGILWEPSKARWGTCASDRCFHNRLLAPLLRWAKVLPVDRGAGLEQEGMRVAAKKLKGGQWVHVFPEGTRRGDDKPLGNFKRGIGQLVIASRSANGCPPLVLPFAHRGMKTPGRNVSIAFGHPVFLGDLLSKLDAGTASERYVMDNIAHRIEERVRELHDGLHNRKSLDESRSRLHHGVAPPERKLPACAFHPAGFAASPCLSPFG